MSARGKPRHGQGGFVLSSRLRAVSGRRGGPGAGGLAIATAIRTAIAIPTASAGAAPPLPARGRGGGGPGAPPPPGPCPSRAGAPRGRFGGSERPCPRMGPFTLSGNRSGDPRTEPQRLAQPQGGTGNGERGMGNGAWDVQPSLLRWSEMRMRWWHALQSCPCSEHRHPPRSCPAPRFPAPWQVAVLAGLTLCSCRSHPEPVKWIQPSTGGSHSLDRDEIEEDSVGSQKIRG